MPLEATVIILDNSVYSINGDYPSSRFGAQKDAANILFNFKTNSNPESVVGIMTSAGQSPAVLVTPTQDAGKVHAAMHTVKQTGQSDLATAIQIAQLALKHRQNKSQKQRIIVFVGSPLVHKSSSKEALTALGKKLKKNNVAVDLVSLGEVDDNQESVQALIDSANASDNCHLLVIPPGNDVLLSDAIVHSPILAEEAGQMGIGGLPGGSGSGSGAGAANGDADFQVDPNLDPELAMALRMSLEDERARQAASSGPSHPQPSDPVVSDTSNMALDTAQPDLINVNDEPALSTVAVGDADTTMADADEDAELAAALAMSRGEEPALTNTSAADEDVDMGSDDLDEEEEVRRAIALSLQGEQQQQDDKPKK